MLLARVVTALVLFGALFASVLQLSARELSLVFCVVALFGAWEWSRLSGLHETALRVGYVGGVSLALLALAVFAGMLETPHWHRIEMALAFACLLWVPATWCIVRYPEGAWLWNTRWARCLMGVLVLAPTWLALSALRALPDGEWLVLYLVLLVSCADIGSYFCGRRWGSVKMLPAVSPGKTWVGVFGGTLSAAVFAAVFWARYEPSMLVSMLALSVVIGLFSVAGDLLESMLKRQEGIKDSGEMLVGHGGVLDRIDSLTAAGAPFTLAWFLWFRE